METNTKKQNNILLNYLDKTSKKLSKKIRVETVLQIIFTTMVILLNISIIVLSSIAIKLGVNEIKKGVSSNQQNIYITVAVAAFTIALFVLAIIQSIFKSKAKTYNYKKMFESIQYVTTLYVNDADFNEDKYKQNMDEIEKIGMNKPNQKIKDIILNILSEGNKNGN
ncbi:hypothetical protein [Mycoplasmopsis lipofaciens]|uniref:hypothetical protein n=1 Tax=Mycoplasmopsis lipofaciens TaxID=114884 RepID=UPI000484DCFC|nr:hypothetical protein [Mycoplasmopsis lipofaciens]